jgi:hypothetical protein
MMKMADAHDEIDYQRLKEDADFTVATANRLLDELASELSAAVGYMRNARIDLETGAPKATAIRTLDGGLKRAEAALAKFRA